MSAATEAGPGERRGIDERGRDEASDGEEEEERGDEAEERAAVSRTERSLRAALGPYEEALRAAQGALVWERPGRSAAMGLGLNGLFWLLSTTPLRLYFLLAISLLALVWLQTWIHFKHRGFKAQWTDNSDTESWAGAQPKLLSLPELCRSLAECWESLNAYCSDVLLYRAQHPDRFCARVCACCLGFAIVGHYVPGIMIAYIIVVSVLLWPLVVYHELIQKMYNRIEPVLMKLDYSMRGGMLGRSHEQRRKGVRKEKTEGNEPTAETDSDSEGELSTYCGKVDMKRTALAFSITDTELSDEEASILESEGFSISRGNTPPPPPPAATRHRHDDCDLQNNLEDSLQFRGTGQQRCFVELACGAHCTHTMGVAETIAGERLGETPPTPTLLFVDTHFNERVSDATTNSPSPLVAIEELGETLAKEILQFMEPTGMTVVAASPEMKEPTRKIAGSIGSVSSNRTALGCAAGAAQVRSSTIMGSSDEAKSTRPQSHASVCDAEDTSDATSCGDVGQESPMGSGVVRDEGEARGDIVVAGGTQSASHVTLPGGGCEQGSEDGSACCSTVVAAAKSSGDEAGSGTGVEVGARSQSGQRVSGGCEVGILAAPISTDPEGDDFELVDEAEVEQLGAEMRSSERSADAPGSVGFFSSLLG